MDLRRTAKHLSAADSMIRANRRRGRAGRSWVWIEAEAEQVRKHYPDIRAAKKALPRRTMRAIQDRAWKLGYVPDTTGGLPLRHLD